MPTQFSLSVVVPVYNSRDILPDLIKQLLKVLADCSSENEIILVNDDSWDNSWEVICQLARDHRQVRGINLMRDYGQHNALLAGIRQAKHDVIVTIDDDLQHPPEEIPNLLKKLSEGHDVVYGTPQTEQHGLWRDLASKATKMALRSVMNIEIARQPFIITEERKTLKGCTFYER